MKNRRILVIGASGFVGKNLVPALAARNPVTILVRPTSNIDLFKNDKSIRIRYGDLETGEGIEQALQDVDAVIHCAARTMGRTYWEFYRTNTSGTANLVRTMEGGSVRKLLYLSSHAACGPSAGSEAKKEQHEQTPISFYGRTKKLAEDLIRNSNLSYVIVRPVSVYGPHDKEILTYIKLLNGGICPVIGYGHKYLNLIFVKDLVALIVNIIERDLFSKRTYFAHDGKCYSLHSVLDSIASTLGKKNLKIHIPESIAMFVGLLNDALLPPQKKLVTRDKIRELACQAWVCSNERITEELHFKPRYSFEQGIAETIDWYRKYGFLS
ncbi:MAG: NAD-dependent epimerase/dehydratase family protein [candidate division WOR-3 bacterium]|nr:MAG: NAD-dependent epimerase/dehydratase family protein [candidate division WOR-3 bacterium]